MLTRSRVHLGDLPGRLYAAWSASTVAVILMLGVLSFGIIGCGPDTAQRAAADTAAAQAVESLAPAGVRVPAPPPAPRAAVVSPARCVVTSTAPGERGTWRNDSAGIQPMKYGTSTKLGAACDTIRVVKVRPAPPPPAPAVVVSVSAQVDTMHFATQAMTARVTRGGAVDSTARPAWSFAPAAVCVAQDPTMPGRVRALADGTCTATARDSMSGVAGSKAVLVRLAPPAPADTTPPPVPPADTAPTPPPPPAGTPTGSGPGPGGARGTLGQARLSAWTLAATDDPPPLPAPARTVPVATAAQLAAALAGGRPGDLVVAAPGRYVGTFVVPSGVALTGPPAVCATLTDSLKVRDAGRAGAIPVLTTTDNANALSTAPGAVKPRVRCVAVVASRADMYNLATFGSHETTDTLTLPRGLVIERSYFDGALGVSRCIAVNAYDAWVVGNWVERCAKAGQDAQAVWGVSGGRLVVARNYLEGAGENLMVGGADPRAPALVLHAFVIRHNLLYKPDAWRVTDPGVVKNPLEFKLGIDGLVEDNVVSGSWPPDQDGPCGAVKSVNQEGAAPWSEAAHLVIRNNRFERCTRGLGIAGHPEAQPVTAPAHHITLSNNVVACTEKWLRIENTPNLTVDGNDATGCGGPGVQFNTGVSPGLVFTHNRVRPDPWGQAVTSADGHGVGQPAADYHAPGAVFRGNDWGGARGATVPAESGGSSAPLALLGAAGVGLAALAGAGAYAARKGAA